MKTLKYITQDGYILLNPEGNTYVGKSANDVLCQVFIRHNIDTYHAQKDVLDFAVKHNKLTVDMYNEANKNINDKVGVTKTDAVNKFKNK